MKKYLVDGTLAYKKDKKVIVTDVQLELLANDAIHAESVALSILSKRLGYVFVWWYEGILPKVTPR